MEEHSQKQQIHTRTYCDQCDYSCEIVADFIKHIQMKHTNPELISCRHCDFKALNKQSLYEHIECDHIEYAMLASVTSSQSELHTNFNQFKNEFSNVFNMIFDRLNMLDGKIEHVMNEKQKNEKNSEKGLRKESKLCDDPLKPEKNVKQHLAPKHAIPPKPSKNPSENEKHL